MMYNNTIIKGSVTTKAKNMMNDLNKILLVFLIPIRASMWLVVSVSGNYPFANQVNNNRYKE